MKQCILPSDVALVQLLSHISPPIVIFIKPRAPESINMSYPEKISSQEAQRIYEDVAALAAKCEHKCSGRI